MQGRFLAVGLVLWGCGQGAGTATDAGSPDADLNLLSQSGLYADFASRAIAPGWMEYTPNYPLWADGLDKGRWISLPAGAKVDTSDMDHWQFPVGTRFMKQFASAGAPLETRLIEKTGDATWKMGAYVWRQDGSDADWTQAGAPSVLGTDHDVPSLPQCQQCHQGEPGKILGFSAIQLPPSVLAMDLYTNPPNPNGYPPPGDATAALAMGTLHGNCGHCHNPGGYAYPIVNQVLRLSTSESGATATPDMTALYQSTVNVATTIYTSLPWRILPGDPSMSAVWARMSIRGAGQMPPIATKHVDQQGADNVAAWITVVR
jgi:hypothetical protein